MIDVLRSRYDHTVIKQLPFSQLPLIAQQLDGKCYLFQDNDEVKIYDSETDTVSAIEPTKVTQSNFDELFASENYFLAKDSKDVEFVFGRISDSYTFTTKGGQYSVTFYENDIYEKDGALAYESCIMLDIDGYYHYSEMSVEDRIEAFITNEEEPTSIHIFEQIVNNFPALSTVCEQAQEKTNELIEEQYNGNLIETSLYNAITTRNFAWQRQLIHDIAITDIVSYLYDFIASGKAMNIETDGTDYEILCTFCFLNPQNRISFEFSYANDAEDEDEEDFILDWSISHDNKTHFNIYDVVFDDEDVATDCKANTRHYHEWRKASSDNIEKELRFFLIQFVHNSIKFHSFHAELQS